MEANDNMSNDIISKLNIYRWGYDDKQISLTQQQYPALSFIPLHMVVSVELRLGYFRGDQGQGSIHGVSCPAALLYCPDTGDNILLLQLQTPPDHPSCSLSDQS